MVDTGIAIRRNRTIKGGGNMANVTTSIRIDAETKKAATELLNDLGLDLSSAVNVFLKQVVLQGGLPFHVENTLKYKPEGSEAMEEVNES
ncbi:MAG: type II toxin-antitoxin system RelB/DinJ family antitoxin [Lachnoclostridium sp.]